MQGAYVRLWNKIHVSRVDKVRCRNALLAAGGCAAKLLEDLRQRLAHHVAQHVQPACSNKEAVRPFGLPMLTESLLETEGLQVRWLKSCNLLASTMSHMRKI